MPTTAQARVLHSNINAYVSLAFVAVFTFACGLILWQAIFNINPVEKLFLPIGFAEYNAN